MTDLFDWLPPLRKQRTAKPKRPVRNHRHDLKALYYAARVVMFKRELPRAWAAGLYHDNDFPNIETTNGTQRYIQDVINNLGHHAERVNTTGIPRKDARTGEVKWTYSGSTTGSADIPCEIKISSHSLPVGWKIEVKNKDVMSKGQLKYQAKMQRIGVLHSVIWVGGLDDFWDEFNRILKL